MACEADGKKLYGFQFHPEVTIVKRAACSAPLSTCGLGSWRMDDFVDEQLAKIRNYVVLGRSAFALRRW